jgi:hypothetical protein
MAGWTGLEPTLRHEAKSEKRVHVLIHAVGGDAVTVLEPSDGELCRIDAKVAASLGNLTSGKTKYLVAKYLNGGMDGTRTRDLLRDRQTL